MLLANGLQNVFGIKRAGIDLTESDILKTLITFAVPIVLTTLLQQIYSIVATVLSQAGAFLAAFLSAFSSMVNGSGFAALRFALGIISEFKIRK